MVGLHYGTRVPGCSLDLGASITSRDAGDYSPVLFKSTFHICYHLDISLRDPDPVLKAPVLRSYVIWTQ